MTHPRAGQATFSTLGSDLFKKEPDHENLRCERKLDLFCDRTGSIQLRWDRIGDQADGFVPDLYSTVRFELTGYLW